MLALVLFFCMVVAAAIWNGIVLQALWGWFIVPTFSLPNLSLAVAIGMSLLAEFVTYQYVPTKNEDIPKAITYTFTYPAIVLVMGFVVYLFV